MDGWSFWHRGIDEGPSVRNIKAVNMARSRQHRTGAPPTTEHLQGGSQPRE